MKLRTTIIIIYVITLILLLTCSDPGLWDLLDQQAGCYNPGANPTPHSILPFWTPRTTPAPTPSPTPGMTMEPNRVPVAGDDSTITLEDVAVDFDVLENDTDPDGDPVAILSVSAPSNGTAVFNKGRVIYTPGANYFGPDSFTYTIGDGKGGTDTGTVTVTVTGVNDPPVAGDDLISTGENTAVDIDVLSNDTDVDGDSLNIVSVQIGANGTSIINTGLVAYTPNTDYSGTDIFTYTISDGNGGSATGTVIVSVIESPAVPSAGNDTASTDEDTPVEIDVLVNDTHPDMDPLVVSTVSEPVNGTAVINSGRIIYTPDPDYFGTDTFIYTVRDLNGDTDTATVTVTVIGINDDPAASNDSAAINEDTQAVINVLANDMDAEGDPLSIAGVGIPANGSAIINGNQVIYTPKTNFFGTDTFSYTVSDGNGGTDSATVMVTINGINDPPAGADDSASTNEDIPANINVLANDTDPDGDTLSIAGVGGASNGATEISMGRIIYTPDTDFYGVDSFEYTVSDGNSGTDTAVVSIIVYGMNDIPATVDDSAATNEDTQLSIDVLANDTDPDGDTLSIANVGNPPNGTAVINADRVMYTPDANFNGSDFFVYTVSDGNGGTDSATVTVTVTGINDNPVALNDSATTNEDIPVSIYVLSNDTDVDGDSLTIADVGSASDGTAVIDGNHVVYTPDTGFSGIDAFSYTISDGNGGIDSAAVTVTVYGMNDDPIAQDDSAETNEDTPVTINVLANDTDPDEDSLTIASAGKPPNGTTEINMDRIVYTPNAHFFGADFFSYTISDGNGGTGSATVSVTVTGVNDDPVAVNDSAATNEDVQVEIDVLANDTDADGDSLAITGVGSASNGTPVINMGKVIYTPDAQFFGSDTFSYTVSDGHGGTDSATVTVTVYGMNDDPVALNDSATTNEDTAVIINVLANDTDPDGDSLGIAGVGIPSKGTAVINSNQITYTPNLNFYGSDTFSYTVGDGNGGTDSATVTVTVNGVNDSPQAENDSAATNEDTAVIINVLANDTDPDGDSLGIAGVGIPSKGTAVINSNQITYTPNLNFYGSDTFSYTVGDGNGGTDSAAVTVTVYAMNDDPVAVNDSSITNEDTPVDINVLGNDTDPDGDTLSIAGAGTPADGTAVINAGKIRYTPDVDFYGTDTFTYSVSDGNGGTDTAIVTVTVNGVNDNPSAGDDLTSTDEDTPVDIDVLANDTDPDGDTLNIASTGTPANGTAVINAGKIRYTPDPGFNGSDTFSYTVNDGKGGSDTGNVTVFINMINDNPVAGDDTAVTNEDTAVMIDVLANDTDPDEDILTITNAGGALYGTVVINMNQVSYTPDPNFHGTDSFSYTVSDGKGGTDTAAVSVTVNSVNDNPVAVNDSATTNEDTGVSINVRANDSDPDGDTLTISTVGSPGHGSAVINSGQIVYTPDLNFYGADTFSYTVSDGNGGTDTATVNVTVNGINDAPVAVNDSAATNEDTAVTVNVRANDSDPDGDPLTITNAGSPANGSAVINSGQIIYTPNTNFFGTDTFSYTISDGKGGTGTATVTVTVNGINDKPVAVNDSATTNEDNAVAINVRANDSDPDGDTLTIATVGSPANGSTVINSGQVIYTPDTNFHGLDTFSYTVSDGNGGTDTATVTVTVNSINDDPVAENDSTATNEDTAVTIDVRANDSDPEGDPLTISAVGLPANGSAVINMGQITYTPNVNFYGTDTFTYTVGDGNGGTATATVIITVNGINDDPLAVNDSAVTNEDTAVTINVKANDSDPDDDTLSIAGAGTGSNGTTLITMGQIRYTPDPDFYGTDSFAYTISDGNGGTDTATVTVTVNSINDDPAAVNDTAATDEDNAVTIDVLANDSDPEGDTLVIFAAGSPANGSAVINSGRIIYTPNVNFFGTDTFTYTVSDGNGGMDSATVTVTVNGINDDPVAVNDTATTNEDMAVNINVLANDSDPDGDTLSIANAGAASNGTTAINMGKITYTPNLNFFGTDSFTYIVSDGNGGTDTATVNVTVNSINDDPVAVNDSAVTDEDNAVTINVRANDSDPEGDAISISGAGNGSHGTTLVTMGQIRYTPDSNFHGTDSFTYTISDGKGGTDSALVTVTVNSINDDPVAVNDSAVTNEDTVVNINVLANDSDPDGDSLSIASAGSPSNGTTAIVSGRVRYTPNTNFHGADSFTYIVSDGNGGTDSATVSVTVNSINDNPVAVNDTAATNEDTAVTINVRANDSDPDGDSLTISGVGSPSHGTAVNNAGQVVYTPATNYFGSDTFSYTISDGNGGTASGTVTVTVTGVNDPPDAVNDSAVTDEDTMVSIDVLANDTDVDGDTLSITNAGAPANGSAVINGGRIDYTPDPDYAGTDSFTYTISDGNGGTDTATVNVTVNDLPEPTPTPEITATPTSTPQMTAIPPGEHIVYEDGLVGWSDTSYNCTPDYNGSSPVYSGSAAIAYAMSQGWCELRVKRDEGALDLSPYTHLNFYIHGGGTGGQLIDVYLGGPGNTRIGQLVHLDFYVEQGSIAANTWRLVQIPIEAFNTGAIQCEYINLVNDYEAAQNPVYIDFMLFVDNPAGPTPIPTPGGEPTPTPTAGPTGITNNGLKVQYKCGEAQDFDNHIKPHLLILNQSGNAFSYDSITARYYYTKEGACAEVSVIDYSYPVGSSNITITFADDPESDYRYMEVGFTSGAGSFPAGGNLEIQSRFNKTDWSDFNEVDDYSYDPSKTTYTDWDRVTLYVSGTLAWGTEPDGSTPQGTMYTPAPTPETTPDQPTATPDGTEIPTTTPTPIPTSEPTPTPAAGLKVQYRCGETSPSTTQIKPVINIVNTGSSGVTLSNLTMKYYYSKEGSSGEEFHVDYAVVGSSNVTGTLNSGHALIGFTSGAGTLSAGGQTGEIQIRINKTDWSSYDQSNDYSFDSSITSFADYMKITLYNNGTLVWGTEQ